VHVVAVATPWGTGRGKGRKDGAFNGHLWKIGDMDGRREGRREGEREGMYRCWDPRACECSLLQVRRVKKRGAAGDGEGKVVRKMSINTTCQHIPPSIPPSLPPFPLLTFSAARLPCGVAGVRGEAR